MFRATHTFVQNVPKPVSEGLQSLLSEFAHAAGVWSFAQSARNLAHLAAGFLALAAAGHPVAGQCHYTWEQIPNPGSGAYCNGTCLNNHGVVAGFISTAGDTETAFVCVSERIKPAT